MAFRLFFIVCGITFDIMIATAATRYDLTIVSSVPKKISDLNSFISMPRLDANFIILLS